MKAQFIVFSVCILTVIAAVDTVAQELYTFPEGVTTRWISLENTDGAKGEGGKENDGAKGHPFDTIDAGESLVLANIQGAGIIHRMWITINNRSPEMLRSLRLEMFWDGAETPAVAVPFGDFFGIGLGKTVAFENALFSNPEGRSFNFTIPMPFRSSARIVLTNDAETNLNLVFYDINYSLVEPHSEDVMYFHAHWRREMPTKLGNDFEILPKVEGHGRYLGTNIGVVTDSLYQNTWWGEGEVKIYLDGDSDYATLVGTGTEDYIGTGWGQGAYFNQYQGCSIADAENREWAFYRYHIPDPVYFVEDCKVTIQQMGGAAKPLVQRMKENGAVLRPISIDGGGSRDRFIKLLEMEPVPELTDPDLPVGWTNYLREDDVSATAYFYLDKPENGLPPLAPVEVRTAGL